MAAGALVAATSAPGSDEATVKAAIVRDELISVYPWIPCANGRPAALSATVVQAQQRRMAALFQRTYAPSESTHAALLRHLQGLVGGYGVGGSAVVGGDVLCEPSGGGDGVRVLDFSMNRLAAWG